MYDVATGRALRTNDTIDWPDAGTEGEDESDVLEMSPDGTRLAVRDGNEIVMLDATTLRELRRLPGPHALIRSLEFSPDSRLLSVGSDDGLIAVRDAASGDLRAQLEGHAGSVRGAAFSADGSLLYSVAQDGGLHVWDLTGSRRFISGVAAVTPRPDFHELVLAAPDGGGVAFFDATPESGERAQTIELLDVDANRVVDPITTSYANWGSFHPEGDLLATPGDEFVRIWRWREGTIATENKVGDGPIEAVTYTPDGKRILVGEESGTVYLLDATSLERVGPRVELRKNLRDVLVSPDGRIAVVLLDGATAVIDLERERLIRTTPVQFLATYADIDPTARLLAVGGVNGKVGVLDIGTGTWAQLPRQGHAAFTLRVAWSGDGATFATSAGDGSVNLWDGRTGELLSSFTPGATPASTAVEFLPDGHTLLIATGAGEVFHWDLRSDHWIAFACGVVARNLSPDEWRGTFGDRPYRKTCPDAGG